MLTTNKEIPHSDINIDHLAISLLKRYWQWLSAFFAILITLGTIEYRVLERMHEFELNDLKTKHTTELNEQKYEMKDQLNMYILKNETLKLRNELLTKDNEKSDATIRELKMELNDLRFKKK